MKEKIFVTQPSLPPLQDYIPYLQQIWDSKILTNNGQFHQQLEKELADFLGVKLYISLCKRHIGTCYCFTDITNYW